MTHGALPLHGVLFSSPDSLLHTLGQSLFKSKYLTVSNICKSSGSGGFDGVISETCPGPETLDCDVDGIEGVWVWLREEEMGLPEERDAEALDADDVADSKSTL